MKFHSMTSSCLINRGITFVFTENFLVQIQIKLFLKMINIENFILIFSKFLEMSKFLCKVLK